MTRVVKGFVAGITALPLFALTGCGSYGDHDRYGSRYDDDGARRAGYYQDTRAADRSTGMTPGQYRRATAQDNGGYLAPENQGTTHADRVENHQAHEDHLDREYGQ